MNPKRRLVVVGNGMAGARFVEDLLARGGGDRFDVTVFGDEPCGNYNRILLSSVLAGSHHPDDIVINSLDWYASRGVRLHAGVRVDDIDVLGRQVRSNSGPVESYDELVIATGSRGFVPRIDGLHDVRSGAFKQGTFVFRTLDDCERMLRCAAHARRAAVVGGGLLGLEAAKGLLARGLEVHVLHLKSHLMETQLDAAGGGVLRRQLEQMGLHVHLEMMTTAIHGSDRVTAVAFKDGSTLECDMVVIAAGISPNVDLAARAGLVVERGIVVGDDLACAGAAGVYAIGECAQHRGQVYGLVAPAWEQAQVLADRLSGRSPQACYTGSRTSTKLKVAGVTLAVMGDKDPVGDDDEVVSYAEPSRGIYKKLIVRNNRLVGAIVMGDGAAVPALVQAFADGMPLPDHRPGLLFPMAVDQEPVDAERIPDSARICDCNAVSKAQIIEAVLGGAMSVAAVSEVTRACTGCGSCKPEVERIVALAREGLTTPEVLVRTQAAADAAPDAAPLEPVWQRDGTLVVTKNKIERYKSEKDGLSIVPEVPRLAEDGWQAIDEGDRERLKWAGVFFRRQTPGLFMMRVRMPNGLTNAAQIRTLAEICRDVGPGFADITTRQQVQLRGFGIERVPEIWERLQAVGLGSLQTGMDNVRNVLGCPAAGLTKNELFDALPVVREFTDLFLRNTEYTNLPRKFNVAITGCLEHCIDAESQDLALTPALSRIDDCEVSGFNVMVGGKMGSGGYRVASPLDVFVRPEDAAALCGHVTLIFRDHGSRAARNKARLAFLVEEWGAEKFRRELQRRVGRPLATAGRDARLSRENDHLGVSAQKQPGLNSVGLTVPAGRITTQQLFEVARVAAAYGDGAVRVTTSQNLIISNVADAALRVLLDEPLLQELQHDPPSAIRGLVSCTGIDYCHLALVETKELALKTARHLSQSGFPAKAFRMHWSGCPAGCGNHAAADVGLLGKNIRVNGEIIEAVDVFVGGKSGANARPGTKVLEDVPCDDLPQVLERLIPYLSKSRVAAPSSAAPSALRDAPAAGRHAGV